MIRITVEITKDTYEYLVDVKNQRGSSISFEANSLVEQAIKERNRKKKLPLRDADKKDHTI